MNRVPKKKAKPDSNGWTVQKRKKKKTGCELSHPNPLESLFI